MGLLLAGVVGLPIFAMFYPPAPFLMIAGKPTATGSILTATRIRRTDLGRDRIRRDHEAGLHGARVARRAQRGRPDWRHAYEHTVARKLTAEMGECIGAFERGDAEAEARFRDAGDRYRELLTNHIYKEDNILFNMGDHAMTDGDRRELCSKFCEVGCNTFGGKKREELEAVAGELETRWPDS